MVDWLALVRIRNQPDRQAAERVAIGRFGADLIRVQSVLDFEEAQREADALRKRRKREDD